MIVKNLIIYYRLKELVFGTEISFSTHGDGLEVYMGSRKNTHKKLMRYNMNEKTK